MPKKNMIRNVNTDYIDERIEKLGLKKKHICGALGKQDQYIGNIKRQGISDDTLDTLVAILKIDKNDPRLYVGGVAMDDDDLKNENLQTNWSVRDSVELHKMRSDMALMRNTMCLMQQSIEILLKELGVTQESIEV